MVRRLTSCLGIAAAVGGACSPAIAQNSGLRFLVSINGGPFAPTQLALPGDVATVVLQAVAPAGVAVDGFAGITCSPQVTTSFGTPIGASNIGAWSPAVSSDDPGGPGVDPATGLGRPQPFGLPGFQSNPTTNAIPNGIAFGGLGAGGALAIAQFPRTLSINSFGNYFDPSPSPIIFRFRFTIPATQSSLDTYSFDVPPSTIQSQANWYNPASPTQGLQFPATRDTIAQGQLILVPAPSGLAALGIVGAALAARRRARMT